MMGLEILLEAVKYLEYKAAVEARGGFPDLRSSGTSTSVVLPTSSHNSGFANHGVVSNGIHCLPQPPFQFPKITSVIPHEELGSGNGFQIQSDHHTFRPIKHISRSPTLDDKGETNRATKNRNLNGNRSSSSVTREFHNKLEKNRRAHIKECFEILKSHLPTFEDRKVSNLTILRSSLRNIQNLKRKGSEYEGEMERLAREKITLQHRLATLKKDMLGKWDHVGWPWPVEIQENSDVDIEDHNGSKIDTVCSELLEYSSSESEPKSSCETTQSPKMSERLLEPVQLPMNNRHLMEESALKKPFGDGNEVMEISSTSPISLVTTSSELELSSSPLAAVTVEDTADSPVGGASYVNNASEMGISVINKKTM